jgi:hypothetical protein
MTKLSKKEKGENKTNKSCRLTDGIDQLVTAHQLDGRKSRELMATATAAQHSRVLYRTLQIRTIRRPGSLSLRFII